MLELIISGGQTGSDTGGLIGARRASVPTAGTAPKGYRTSTGQNLLLKAFNLIDEGDLRSRTIKNIIDSDGTVVLTFNDKSPGSILTVCTCRNKKKPVLEIDLNPTVENYESNVEELALQIALFVSENKIKTLNVAGNRERSVEGICTNTVADIIYKACALLKTMA